MTTTTVYRSPLTSAGTFINVLALSCIAVGLVLAAATTVGFPDSAIGPGLLVPLIFSAWRAWRLSIRIEGAALVICNPWRDHRIEHLQSVTTGTNKSAKGMSCLAFVNADGRAIPAIAGTIWMWGVLVERPGRTIERLARFLVAVRAGRDHRFRVDVPPELHTAMRAITSMQT